MGVSFFPGGNTPDGFCGFFGNILPDARARRVYYIKGGSGVGKSTFMRRIGQHCADRGFEIEYFNCSSDPGSLDGMAVPKLGLAMMDGTAPHIMDPRLPGVRDFTINLGEFLDEAQFKGRREWLENTMQTRKAYFERAYVYIKAAALLFADAGRACMHRLRSDEQIMEELEKATGKLTELHNDENGAVPYGGRGIVRRLFADAITPDGIVSTLETLPHDGAVCVELPWGCNISPLLERLAAQITRAGFDVTLLMNPLRPANAMHLYAPGIELLVSADGRFVDRKLHFDSTIQGAKGAAGFAEGSDNAALRADAAFDQRECMRLLEEAVSGLNRARTLHADVESVYSSAMDFEAAGRLREQITDMIDTLKPII